LELSKDDATVATTIVMGLASLFIVVGGSLSDKYRPRTALIVSAIGSFVGALILVIVGLNSLIIFSVFYFVLNASHYIGSPATSAMLAERVSPEQRGKIFGALFSLGQVLSVVFPFIFGFINDRQGVGAAFSFILGIAVVALVIGVYIYFEEIKREQSKY